MRTWPRLFFCLAISLTMSGCLTPMVRLPPPLPPDAIPQVIAVSSFDNRSGFQGQWQLGAGMADLLVSELVQSRNFVVVERVHLRSVVNEIDRQKDSRFRPEGKVDDGRLKNAKYLIRGVINDFSQVGKGSIGVAIRSLLFGGRGYTARVSLTLTIVEVESGEIIDSVQAAGLARAKEAYVSGAYKDVAFGGDKFFRTPLGMATANAIRRGVRGIVKKMPRVMWEPMVADVNGDVVILNGGRDRGVREGTIYHVRGEGHEVTDPVTGDILSVVPGPVLGSIRVSSVEDHIAYAKLVNGSGFKRGQILERTAR